LHLASITTYARMCHREAEGIFSLASRTPSSLDCLDEHLGELRVQKTHQDYRVASIALVLKFASEQA
jgi:hypothetical protein